MGAPGQPVAQILLQVKLLLPCVRWERWRCCFHLLQLRFSAASQSPEGFGDSLRVLLSPPAIWEAAWERNS